MSGNRLRLVIDASVGIKLFVNETLSESAQVLFEALANDSAIEFYVPDLFYIECTNILLKYMRRFGRSLEDTQSDLLDLKLLNITSIPMADLIEDTLILAHEWNLTAYDASYAALARRLDVPLITADRKLAEGVEWAAWLGDFAL